MNEIDRFIHWAYINDIDFSRIGRLDHNGMLNVPEELEDIKNRFLKEISNEDKRQDSEKKNN